MKRCPVCSNIGRAYGKKTCGAPLCISEWKTWSASVRIKATQIADNPSIGIDLKDLDYNSTTTPSDQAQEKQSNLDLTNQTAKQELDKIFGKKGDS